MKADMLKNLVPLAILAAFAVGLVAWWRFYSGNRDADAAQAASNGNTYGGGAAVSPNASQALLEAMFAGAVSDQSMPSFPHVGQSAPLAQPGSQPATLSGPNTSQGM